jgi:hypothetical protein
MSAVAPVGIVDGGDHRLAVDFERQRRAKDREPVRVVGRAVDGIEHPAEMRNPVAGLAAAELLAEHGVVGKTLGNHGAKPALDLDVDLGDEIDDALLVDADVGPEVRHLHFARAHDGLDGRGEKQWLRDLSHRRRAS